MIFGYVKQAWGICIHLLHSQKNPSESMCKKELTPFDTFSAYVWASFSLSKAPAIAQASKNDVHVLQLLLDKVLQCCP